MADLQEAGLKLVAEGADAFENTLDGIGSVLAGFGSIAVEAASMAAEALGEFFADSFAGALEAEQTLARLGQVIESTGGIAGVTVQDAEALADEFKNLAGGSDDAIISIIDMGLRMGTISEDEMPAFIQTTLDLGSVMGDTARASQILARAQEDPIGTLGALRKAGILVSEEMEAQIKAMVKSGDTAGAYSLLMDRVGEATEGAAETMANTTAGQWAIFQETIADAGETIVGAFLPALNGILAGFMPLVPIISEVATVIGNIIGDFIATGGDFGTVIDNVREGFAGILPPDVIDGIVNAVVWFRDEMPGILEAGRASIQPVIDAATALGQSFADSMPIIQEKVEEAIAFVKEQFDTFGPPIIENVTKTLGEIKKFWDEHGDEILEIVKVAFEVLTTTIGGLMVLVSGAVTAGMEILNGDWTGAWETVKATARTFMEGVLNLVGTDLDTFISDWQGTFDMLDDVIDIGTANVLTWLKDGLNAAVEGAKTVINGFADVGTAIMDAIVQSIKDGASGVINAMLGALQDAIDSAQALLGIHSPSKLAMKMIGAPFSKGIAEGILAGIKGIDSAVSMAITPMISPPMSAGAIGAQYAYNNSTTITNNLSVHTPKPMTSVIGEFATMQTIYGAGI